MRPIIIRTPQDIAAERADCYRGHADLVTSPATSSTLWFRLSKLSREELIKVTLEREAIQNARIEQLERLVTELMKERDE